MTLEGTMPDVSSQSSPVVRIWRGRTRPEDRERYVEYLKQTGVRECRATPGNLDVRVFTRITAGAAEFVFVSTWASRDAIAAFAGEDTDRAVYYPEDSRYLLEREPTVTHYDLVVSERAER
jgi:quinol monooxygenase YgiN